MWLEAAMIREIVFVFATYLVIGAVAGLTRGFLRRRLMGFLGLILVIQPVAMAAYRHMDPWLVLVLVVCGVFLLLFAAGGKREK
jgi:hypothetical protein